MKKQISLGVILIVLLTCISNIAGALDEEWKVVSSRLKYYDSWYRNKKGIATVNGIEYEFSSEGYVKGTGSVIETITNNRTPLHAYYYIDEDDYVVTGWKTIDGKTYYFRPSGTYQGQAMTKPYGFVKIDDSYYYFDEVGVMITGFVAKNETYYCFGDDGKQLFGWHTIGSNRYYFDLSNGSVYRGSHTIDGKRYRFSETGELLMGIVVVHDEYGSKHIYGYDENGTELEGWQEIDGKTYYFRKGQYYSEAVIGLTQIEGDYYYFNHDDGSLIQNCLITNEYTFYAENDGKLASGWKTVAGNTYYFSTQNRYKAVTGIQYIDGKRYLFAEDGHMLIGLQNRNGQLFFYDTDGSEVQGWKTIEGKTYYFDQCAVKGTQYINGEYYYFDDDCVMQTGLFEMKYFANRDIEIYAFGEDGKMLLGWQTINGRTYYFHPEAYRNEKVIIDDRAYLFSADGTLHVHTLKILPGYEATSIFSGLTDGKICTACGEIVEEQEETAPTLRWGNDYFSCSIGDGYFIDLPKSFYKEENRYVNNEFSVMITWSNYDKIVSSIDVIMNLHDKGFYYYRNYSYDSCINDINIEVYERSYDGIITTICFFDSDARTYTLITTHTLNNKPAETMVKAIIHNIRGRNPIKLNGWVSDTSGKQYYYENGEKSIGVQVINNKIYWFDQNGVLQEGLFESESGLIYWGPYLYYNGIYEVEGEELCFSEEGFALEGWIWVDGKFKYFSPAMLRSYAYSINGETYCFNADGSLFTDGWYESASGSLFLADEEGKTNLGWNPEISSWIYVNEDGNQEKYKALVLPTQLNVIDENAFEGIDAQIVVLPKTCTTIKEQAFANCRNLLYVICNSSISSIADNAFENSDCSLVQLPNQ